MKTHKRNGKREFQVVLAYYKQTVWKYVEGLSLCGAQYDVASRAWERLDTAHRSCFSLPNPGQLKSDETMPDIQSLKPRRLKHDNSITPEL
ncbi:MAG: hypothetical protein KGL39_59855, partial [Patescibacteria group bacterium]|nr:hypothetical protein [Patescibacteria group bacterium]